ncbi:hypothetical protein QM565_10665 [Geitlerinema splendidum]|nr:hypothetical protein [Geitlerinema splendidum]
MTQVDAKIAIATLDPQQIWQGFHWLFFVNTQGLIVSLRRFERYLSLGNSIQAQMELETATELMLASGALMHLAGSVSRQAYEQQIRPSMSPPNVQSNDFSGLMSWDHAALVELWKKLRPVFKTLPATLQPQHQRFVQAYFSLTEAHRSVCQKFGGDEIGSLRCEKSTAVNVLDKFTRNRTQLIDPNHQAVRGCPFHPHA